MPILGTLHPDAHLDRRTGETEVLTKLSLKKAPVSGL
jgi:hypothetical protein